MPQKQIGWIEFNDNSTKTFKASSPSNALVAAQETLKLRSLTRQTIDKVGVRSIHFGTGKEARVIYPIKRKRSLHERRDQQATHERPACASKLNNNVGHRRHRHGQKLPKAA